MPLSRYEIRSEYSLANPDLYRVADKDDPEGLLEGVAMAGLVGIIRQLGDLAEFAAEVFHDLHEDVLAIAGRGHELLLRVRQLETEAPLIEKMMMTKIGDGKCFYNPGLEWHAHVYTDQNHFTQGDLPRFVRNAYEDCRSPPRLFPLDRFDGAGAGSCLKRFTDPSFFRTEWASSELMKAEKEQRDQMARRLKRKGQQQAYGEAREAKLASHIQLRVPNEEESIETASSASEISFGSLLGGGDSLMQENDDMLLASELLVSETEGSQAKVLAAQDFGVNDPSFDLKMEHSTPDTTRHIDMGVLEDLKDDAGFKDVVSDDSASEADNFMDAVTTMDSEAETDSEMKPRVAVGTELLAELKEEEAPALLASEPWKGGHEEHENIYKDKKCSFVEEDEEGLIIERDISSNIHAPEEPLDTEHAHSAPDSPKVFGEEEDYSFVDGNGIAAFVQDSETSTSNSGNDTKIPSIGEDIVSKAEGHLIDDTPTVCPVEEEFSVVVQSAAVLAVKDDLSSSSSQSIASLPGLMEDAAEMHLQPESNASSCGLTEDAAEMHLQPESNASSCSLTEDADSNSEIHLQSGSANPVFEAPESLVLDKDLLHCNQLPDSDTPCKDLTSGISPKKGFSQLPEPDVRGNGIPQSNSPKDLGTTPTRKRWQIPNLFTKGFSASDLKRDSPHVLESEQSESPRKRSLQSSPSSSIQPMKWVINSSRTYLTDDELEDMQVSSASPSSSSSTLSSPRPSTLATTVLKKHTPQTSAESSSQPPISSSSKFGTKLAPFQSVWQVETSAERPLSPTSGHSANSSPHSSSSAAQTFFDPLPSLGHTVDTSSSESLVEAFSAQSLAANDVEINPPPPPLPPLAWWMTRRILNSLKPTGSSTSKPITSDTQVSPNDLSQAFTSSTTLPNVPHASRVKPSELTPSTTLPTVPHASSVKPSELTLSTTIPHASSVKPSEVTSPATMPTVTHAFSVIHSELTSPTTMPTVTHAFRGKSSELTSSTTPTVPHASSVKPSELTHAFSSPTIGKPTFQKSEVMLDESSTYESGLSDLETLHGRSADPLQVSNTAESDEKRPRSVLGMVERGTISVLATSELKGENGVNEGPDTSLQESFIEDSSRVTSSSCLQTNCIPARLDESTLELQTKDGIQCGSPEVQRSNPPHVLAPSPKRKDLLEATSSHDLSALKKRSKWAWTSSTASSDDREVLLDQIRTRSFSLRNTSREKQAPPRPVTNINVAAILEKANAIRQAFAGSDDDEDWSDG